jgi:uncharacterized membrane protein YecN with MAPEG domain
MTNEDDDDDDDDDVRARQRTIGGSIKWTIPLTLAALVGSYFVVGGFGAQHASSSTNHTDHPEWSGVGYALPWIFVAAIPYFAVCLTILGVRFTEGAHNPLLGQESERLRLHCRVMQNTLEQLVWIAICLLTLTTVLAPSEMRLIPICACLFVVARMVYWWGYTRKGTLGRAPGVQMTFTINIGLLGLTLLLLVTRNFLK